MTNPDDVVWGEPQWGVNVTTAEPIEVIGDSDEPGNVCDECDSPVPAFWVVRQSDVTWRVCPNCLDLLVEATTLRSTT